MKYLLLLLIKGYQKFLSPLKMQSTCRFSPTCSAYAVQAITKHGAIKGLYLAFGRIIRCNPYNPGGFDLVPDKFKFSYLYRRNFKCPDYLIDEQIKENKDSNN